MKIKKSISIDNWVLQEIQTRFPKSRYNLSNAIEGLLIASINNPLAYWRSVAKQHKQKFDLALGMVRHFEEMEQQEKNLAQRNEVIIKALKN